MADYVPKPGSFSLFKNDRKNSDNHPDYAGSGVDLDGNECWINAWLKETRDGKKFFSISLKIKEPKAVGRSPDRSGGGGSEPLARSGGGRGSRDEFFEEDSIPFLTSSGF